MISSSSNMMMKFDKHRVFVYVKNEFFIYRRQRWQNRLMGTFISWTFLFFLNRFVSFFVMRLRKGSTRVREVRMSYNIIIDVR